MKSISPNPARLVAALTASLSLAAPLFAQTITGTDPVKIFIMAGESNMNGKGTVSPATTPGTLDFITLPANDPAGKYQFLKSGGGYVTRADVGIRGLVFSGAPNPGNLTINYGGNASGLIGPELGFGHVIGDAFENKILLIEVGVDGTTLGGSFCPPSSRIGEPEPVVAGDKGFYYNEIIRLVNEAKAALGATPHEIAGLGWHQGWNDRVNAAYSAAYEVNMANFINDIRTDLATPNMPVVIGSAAMDWNYGYSEVERAQLKMVDASAYPAFVGNVAVVDTRQPYDGLEFWQPAHNSPANEGYHWNRSGKTFLHIGMAMGDAMTSLVATRIPYRMRASGGSGGVTLTWNNGTETPTSVRVLRNGVEIAAAAPVSPPSFVDTTAPLGVNNYELQFTMPVSPCPPLSISHDSGITHLEGNQRANGLRLTWVNNLGYTGITVKRDGSVIAASLPGTTTSYTDVSPPTGALTYSVEPVDAGGTPVEVQVAVSAAQPGGALVYEPFDMTAGTALAGKEGGIGLDGKWDGDANIQVTSSGLYTFGSLPVSGNRIARVSGNGSCAIDVGNTLHEAGLMDHGAELWFSFLSRNPDNINPTLVFGNDIATGWDKIAMAGSGIGARLQQGKNVQGIILKDGVLAGNTPNQVTLATSEVVLVVGSITWGADAATPDTIQIYTPGTNLSLDTPQSFSAVVDQSNFKVLSMWGNGATPNMDEIRFGATYLDVIGQSADTSGDLTPPTPATMSFASPPAASSTSAITMTATTASDANGVQYFFDETSGNPGGTDSGWQDSPVYTDTGLDPDTEYTYTVQARDKSVNQNTNTTSAPASATTLPADTNPPPTPGFATPPNATSPTEITMTATTVADPEGGLVEYYFDETSGNPGGSDSGWQSSSTYTDSGLNPNTQYTYTVKARDNASPPNESAVSAPASATTEEGPSVTIIPITSFDPATFFSGGITAGIDFDVDSDGAAGFQAATQPGFLSVPATTAKDYNVTHNGITFDIKTLNANLANQARWRGATTAETAGVLINDFQQWYGRFETEGKAVEAAVTLTGLTPNTDYQISFFTYNVGSGQSIHNFYEGTSSADPLITTFTTAGNQDTYSTWKPGITFQINSGNSGEIAVTIQGIEYIAGSNFESRLTLDGISVVELGGPANSAPTWAADPVNETDATEGVAYFGTLADKASDVDAGDTLEFAKVSGPAWLGVAPDGTLSGTPSGADIGANVFTVSVTDGNAAAVEATLNITVQPAPDPFGAWAASGSGGAVTFDGDTNRDGVKDGLAWLLGASDPDADARGLLPPAETDNGDLVFSFRFLKPEARGNETLALQFSNELGGDDPWENHTIPVPDESGTVGVVSFAITPVEGTDLNEVEATVPASAAQGTGRLFARLLGSRSVP
jgi:hypothetical protein